MSLTTERKIIENHISANLADLQIEYEDLKITPALDPWLQVNILNGQEVQKSAGTPGTNIVRAVGVLAVRVNVLAGRGSNAFRVVADRVMDLFRNVELENIRFMIPYVSGGFQTVGNYSQWTIMCPFTRDEFNG